MKLTANACKVTIPEWYSLKREDLVLSGEDRELCARMAGEAESRLSVVELHNGLQITSRSWVGVVRFNSFELQVIPKLAGNNLGLVELIDFATGLDALKHYGSVRNIETTGTNLFDLIALMLVEAVERIFRGGILSDYCEVEADLPVVRGKILVRPQVLKRYGQIDRVECRYDEYLTNVLDNQILLAALSACRNSVLDPGISTRVRRLLAITSEVCDLDGVDLRLARSTLVYTRMNEHYREAHNLAWLILDGLGIDDIFAVGSHRCFAFLLDMNSLFERFVTRWLCQALPNSDFRVIPQRRDRTILWNADLSRSYSQIIPDLLIERVGVPGVLLPVDAKYKLYDEHRINTSDIYQTFLYAYAFGEHHSILPTAFVLYPASITGGSQTRLHIRRVGGMASAEVRAIPVHIPTALDEARKKSCGPVTTSLLDLIQTTFTKPP